jgi:hypothetical protein
MSKETTIDWKGGKRRIELRIPDEKVRMHIMATAPTPLQMNPTSLGWINRVLVEGSSLNRATVESMQMDDGIGLLGEVIAYWGESEGANLNKEMEEDSDKVAGVNVEGLELDDQGAVDLEDMR